MQLQTVYASTALKDAAAKAAAEAAKAAAAVKAAEAVEAVEVSKPAVTSKVTSKAKGA